MTVWDVDDEKIDRLGVQVGALPFVSHCYRRPRRRSWRYNLFAMVHGRSAAEIAQYRERIRALLGRATVADDILVRTRILTKTGLRLPPGTSPAGPNRSCFLRSRRMPHASAMLHPSPRPPG